MSSDKAFMIQADSDYNPHIHMLGGVQQGPGYHTRIANGVWVHSTRDSAYYALQLLKRGNDGDIARACDIFRTLLTLQPCDPYKQEFGIWPWLYEEPVSQMAPPDWNWADFIGAGVAHAVKEHAEKLPNDLLDGLKEALRRASWSIFRRNVHPSYTNIAIMGATVTGAAGEILGDRLLLEYAESRMQRFLEYTIEQGGLNEYNSPTYTFIALFEVERALQLCSSSKLRESAEKIRVYIWENLARHFHPATRQLSGPHSRAYHDQLNASTVNFLKWATGDSSSAYEPFSIHDVEKHLPCPAHLVKAFSELPEKEVLIREIFIKKQEEKDNFIGTTWMTSDITLGSINRECFWTQRRPLLAYWKASDASNAILRLRLLREEDKDFSCMGLHNVQDRDKILSGIKPLTDRGDYHIHLDRPANGIFTFSELSLRYELSATDACAEQSDHGIFTLSSGQTKAVIACADNCNFNGLPITWSCGSTDGKAFVKATLYSGAPLRLAFDENLSAEIAAGIKFVPAGAHLDTNIPVFEHQNNLLAVTWEDLKLEYVPHGETYDKV